jgi:hypothetical protein
LPGRKAFSGRAFVSLNMTVSFIVLIISSIVLYIMPPGRDAYWTDWTYWSLDKDQWGALHTVGGLAFLVFGIIHLIPYNWKAFWNYVVSRVRRQLNRKVELAGALMLNILIVLVCIFNWFPSSTIMNWGASIKESWVKAGQRAPFPHAELETLADLSKKLSLDLPEVVSRLQKDGITADPEKTVQYIASRNGRSPAQLFEMISPRPAGTPGESPALREGGGWGRKSVKMLSEEFQVEDEGDRSNSGFNPAGVVRSGGDDSPRDRRDHPRTAGIISGFRPTRILQAGG